MKNTKLIAELNSLIGAGRTKLNATLADAILEIRLMHAQWDSIRSGLIEQLEIV